MMRTGKYEEGGRGGSRHGRQSPIPSKFSRENFPGDALHLFLICSLAWWVLGTSFRLVPPLPVQHSVEPRSIRETRDNADFLAARCIPTRALRAIRSVAAVIVNDGEKGCEHVSLSIRGRSAALSRKGLEMLTAADELTQCSTSNVIGDRTQIWMCR